MSYLHTWPLPMAQRPEELLRDKYNKLLNAAVVQFLLLRLVSRRFNGSTLEVLFQLKKSLENMDSQQSEKIGAVQSTLLDRLANPDHSSPAYPSLPTLHRYFSDYHLQFHDRANAMQIVSRVNGKPFAVTNAHLAALLRELAKEGRDTYAECWKQLYALKYALNPDQVEMVLAAIFNDHITSIRDHSLGLKCLMFFVKKLNANRLGKTAYLLLLDSTGISRPSWKTIAMINTLERDVQATLITALFDQLSNVPNLQVPKVAELLFEFCNLLLSNFSDVIDISQIKGTFKAFLLKHMDGGGYNRGLVDSVSSAVALLPKNDQSEFARDFLLWSVNKTDADSEQGGPETGYRQDHIFWGLLEKMNPFILQEMLLALPIEMGAKKLSIFFRRMTAHCKAKLTDNFIERLPLLAVQVIEEGAALDQFLLFDLLIKKIPSTSHIPMVLSALGVAKAEDETLYNFNVRAAASVFLDELLTTGKCTLKELTEAGLEDHVSPMARIFSGWNMTMFGSSQPEQKIESEENKEAVANHSQTTACKM